MVYFEGLGRLFCYRVFGFGGGGLRGYFFVGSVVWRFYFVIFVLVLSFKLFISWGGGVVDRLLDRVLMLV